MPSNSFFIIVHWHAVLNREPHTDEDPTREPDVLQCFILQLARFRTANR